MIKKGSVERKLFYDQSHKTYRLECVDEKCIAQNGQKMMKKVAKKTYASLSQAIGTTFVSESRISASCILASIHSTTAFEF